ncbi:ribonuclease HII [Rhodohalobacter mucosus]|uniref:Ribonuclease HII n=1 Tax=Rhodohalobacter mucosus TaxID=2079485 RepID=A0A316TKT6_9BACT|nr:ribonuclease HII [Rhodohalobacter mucosus]PWN05157.1 ribonuclease HII [Rhodohalobacter mucosus]
MDRYRFEKQLWSEGFRRIMGLDEVGRGCLCGPVVAAGVIIRPDYSLNRDVADSKTLTEKEREELALEIKEESEFWTVQESSAAEIDRINILRASLQAMVKCTKETGANPDYLLVDGNRFVPSLIRYKCVVKGDDKSASIAAASILAKVYRDRLMRNLHQDYPVYGWDTNVGYPTQQHFDGLQKHGYTKHHRKSFKLRTERQFMQTASNENEPQS